MHLKNGIQSTKNVDGEPKTDFFQSPNKHNSNKNTIKDYKKPSMLGQIIDNDDYNNVYEEDAE